MNNNYDFIAIGETTMDAFIRIKDASVHCDVNKENCQICMAFGAKIPYESVDEIAAVGNAANASVSASRLGLRSALVANVGQDKNGDMCIESLKKDGVNTEFIRVNKDKNTNYHYVLWFEDERTILQKHSDFPYILPELGNPKWIYLTSLGEKSLPMHEEIVEFLEKNPEVKMAFQPGIFQIKMGYEKLKKIYQKSEIFFCNVDEAKTILEIKEHIEIKDLIRKMHDLGPKIVILTDGMNGAYGSEDGKDVLFIPSFPDPKPPLERTGAGDAFASTVVSAIILGKDLSFALAWGGINAMSVVQDIGAQRGLLSQEKIEEHLKNASETYKAKTL